MALSDKIIGVESGGDPNAENDKSSASGLGQFIDSTWVATMQSARPDLTAGKSPAEIIAMKSDPDLQRQMVDAYANQNAALLDKAGVPVTDGTKYLAHFAGPQGAIKILQADPTATAESVLGSAAVKANPFLAKMSAGDVAAWAAKKMGAQSPVTAAAGSAPTTAPVGKPAIFAGQTAQSPASAAGPQAGGASPIFAAAAPAAPTAPTAPAAPIPHAVNTQLLAQNLARLRQSSPIFAGVNNMLGKQNA
jgi:hypothetical protein